MVELNKTELMDINGGAVPTVTWENGTITITDCTHPPKVMYPIFNFLLN
ncbi:class IIb bacteriocin, lactobin A/cerein 7B family (plasmid) [Clostridium estertheticum]|nr:class IIb bacteriocin, lactobin A/cerein 7B family [Clostridium estertheticum]MBX4262540.1 class IIb bacteriocin, lactobin A/cerein 7B family [Clostridium estertheticum]WLC73358.1 class IIb bacteriocin, lactobin A/cerein 7B family [Clostridium estertheticum]